MLIGCVHVTQDSKVASVWSSMFYSKLFNGWIVCQCCFKNGLEKINEKQFGLQLILQNGLGPFFCLYLGKNSTEPLILKRTGQNSLLESAF